MCVCVCVCVALTQADAARVQDWLSCVRWRCENPTPHFQINNSPDLQTLQARLAVLRVIQFTTPNHQGNDPTRKVKVTLLSWEMTHETMPLLSALPQWSGILDLSFCTWPIKRAEEYKVLAQHIPTSYTALVMHHEQGQRKRLWPIFEGLSQCRKEKGLPPVIVALPRLQKVEYLSRSHVTVVQKLSKSHDSEYESDADWGSEI